MRRILITGGAGFVGVNAAARFCRDGWRVVVVDNLSRRGSVSNLEWLGEVGEFEFRNLDVRDATGIACCVAEIAPSVILHLAAQVAVTASVSDPRSDFEINALGTLNVLEALRNSTPDAIFIYASTNKVYGPLEQFAVVEGDSAYELPPGHPGVDEKQPLDFYTPYGCSKGVGDQYALNYHRCYGLRTVSLRQSCVYGPRQFGTGDQGWVAWFAIAALLGRPITIYGDGKQSRDLLHVDDLVDAYGLAIAHADRVAGEAFNIGGGPANLVSVRALVRLLEEILDKKIVVTYQDWRPGDQRLFVADTTKARDLMGWTPRLGIHEGVLDLFRWIEANANLFEARRSTKA